MKRGMAGRGGDMSWEEPEVDPDLTAHGNTVISEIMLMICLNF